MKEGIIHIFLSYKEPNHHDNIMWLRPYLDREGYELLYFGAEGWTRFVPCCPLDNSETEQEKPADGDSCKECVII